MGIHKPTTIPDNRKRIEKMGAVGVDREEFPGLSVDYALGLCVRTFLWAGIDEMVGGRGGYSFVWSRDFKGSHITPETCAAIIERHFPGFLATGNRMLEEAKGRLLRDSERLETKAYRYIHSGFSPRKGDDDGTGLGKRHWLRHKGMFKLMNEVQNLLITHGPEVSFDFDLNDPSKAPTLRRKN